ncbi:alpha/beta fold hydrolase [Phytoactinopolyspora limicola]|uniref:alpha/beta fold hydrolase n=1 Tax=Phytoactinopolyspora limicola TaxID=2715536 RepID=UPI001409249C|nr:alpha/beta hydrolase [Phytoactinopolyspora limicola]
MSTALVGGITLGYDDHGAGPPLVLVHGHPFDRTMWRPQVEHFARAGWRVITPDLRGYGQSTVQPGVTTLDTFAGDIDRLLNWLGVDGVILGGLSMGGQIVMDFYRQFPDRIRGLILAATSAHAESDAGRQSRRETAERLLRDGMDGYADEILPGMITPRTITHQPDVATHVMTMMRQTSPAGAAAALRGRAERPDYLATLATVAVPALVIVGTDDAFTPLGDARTIHRQIPHSTLEIIEGAGHLPNLERPTTFNAVLQRFLEALPAATTPPGGTT